MEMDVGEIINRKYQVIKLIGRGQFGQVFLAMHIHTQALVALKQEPLDHHSLRHETTVLHYLASCNLASCKCIPQVLWFGNQNEFRYLAITYCEGESLDKCGKMTFQEKGFWWNQAIACLEHIHVAGIVHRDIKPFHFVRKQNEWFLIDFGLATAVPLTQKTSERIVGSPNYVSYFVHEGIIPSCRDDLISLMYVFWELLFESTIHSDHFVITNESSDSIHHPYNQWVKTQKEWSALYARTVTQNTFPEVKDMMISLLKQGERMSFVSQVKSYSSLLL